SALVPGTWWLWGLCVALGLFASVLVHELAHSLYAVRRGGQVKNITLLMIGGVSQLTQAPALSRDEAIMAFLGPATSFALAALCYVLSLGAGRLDWVGVQFGL